MVQAAGATAIVEALREPSMWDVWDELPIRLFFAALAPLVVILPLRLVFGDRDLMTLMVLGPGFEESLKLGCAVLVLTLASVTLRGGRDPGLALRYWLFLLPWLVGGAFGLIENLLVYPNQVGVLYTLREFAHASFLALAVAAMLVAWRVLSAPRFGIAYGFVAGFAAHVGFNILAVLTSLDNFGILISSAYLAFVAAIALPALVVEVRKVPASAETRAFLPTPGRRLHP